MARVLVVTSHPHFAQGGHLVIATELLHALRRDGHDAALCLTPQNRFGRQGAGYVATWLIDVGVAHDGAPIDQVISLRRAAIHTADRRLLRRVDRLFVLSETVNRRLADSLGVRGDVLYPPAPSRASSCRGRRPCASS